MKNKFKKIILSIPVIGHLLSILNNISRLPTKTNHFDSSILLINDQLTQLGLNISTQNNNLRSDISKTNTRLDSVNAAIDILQQKISDFNQNVQFSEHAINNAPKGLFADNHSLDVFYSKFEDKFRGTESEITERLKIYLPFFKKSKKSFIKYPVLDIGSGRGEMLKLLKDNHINYIGLDINNDMVNRSVRKNLNAVQGDALEHLSNTKSNTYGAITGFHIVEHIPFETLVEIFNASRKALVNDGFVIFETPNPENITVASWSFRLDPSHLNPIPPDLLAFTLEVCGFRNIEILRIHPIDKLSIPNKEYVKLKNLPDEIRSRFYGARDYAVIAYK